MIIHFTSTLPLWPPGTVGKQRYSRSTSWFRLRCVFISASFCQPQFTSLQRTLLCILSDNVHEFLLQNSTDCEWTVAAIKHHRDTWWGKDSQGLTVRIWKLHRRIYQLLEGCEQRISCGKSTQMFYWSKITLLQVKVMYSVLFLSKGTCSISIKINT